MKHNIFFPLMIVLPICLSYIAAINIDKKRNNLPEINKDIFGVVVSVQSFSDPGSIFGGGTHTRINTTTKSLTIDGQPSVSLGDTLWIRHTEKGIFILSAFGNRIFIR